MKAFVFSGLNSLVKEEDRNRYLALDEIQNCFQIAEQTLFNSFDMKVCFNDLARLETQEVYSLDHINLVTTLIVAMQVGISRTLLNKGIVPDILSSISLGDVARTIVSGAISFEEAVHISNVKSEEKKGLDKYGESVAVLVHPNDPVTENDMEVFDTLGGVSQLSPRILNISGSYENMKKLREVVVGRQWRVVHLLNYPFHSDVLKPYSQLMESFLRQLHITDPAIPIFSTTLKRLLNKKSEIIEEQILTMTHPHHWMKSVKLMTQEVGVKEFINIGPCATLAKALRDIDPSIKVVAAMDLI